MNVISKNMISLLFRRNTASQKTGGGWMWQILSFCLAIIIHLTAPAFAAADAYPPKYGPAGAPYATPLWQSHEYFQSAANPAPDFWHLVNHYTGQVNKLSCSTASVAMVLNAIAGAKGNLRADDANVQQTELLDHVKAADWKKRVTENEGKLRKGLTLGELEEVAADALKTYGIKGWVTSRRNFENAGPRDLEALRATLKANEASSDDFIILHFLQDKLTNDPGGPYPHISPVGAYDANTDCVLIFDVDRMYYGPYWVSVERLLSALAAKTPAFGSGGMLIVQRTAR